MCLYFNRAFQKKRNIKNQVLLFSQLFNRIKIVFYAPENVLYFLKKNNSVCKIFTGKHRKYGRVLNSNKKNEVDLVPDHSRWGEV